MSDNVEMIADSVEQLLKGHMTTAVLEASEEGRWAGELWTAIEDAGYTRLLLSEKNGGTGEGWVDAQPLLYALGYHSVPLPVADTMVANALLEQAGLPLEAGPCALVQQLSTSAFELRLDGECLTVSGEARNVPWASFASRIIMAGYAGSHGVIAVLDPKSKGMAITPGRNIAGEPSDTLSFTNCTCSCFAEVDGLLVDEPLLVYGALARAAQIAGLLDWVLSQTLKHAKEREQFGKPLIAQQAVKQSLAVLACEAVAADVAARAACESVAAPGHEFEVGVAKVRAGQAAGVAARIAHQIHGAMGFTYEHALHHATRRLWSWRVEFGNEALWAHKIGQLAISCGGAAFWPNMTARRSGVSEPV